MHLKIPSSFLHYILDSEKKKKTVVAAVVVLTPYLSKKTKQNKTKTDHWNFVSAIRYHTRMDKMLMKMISKFSYPEKEKDVPHQERIKQQRGKRPV